MTPEEIKKGAPDGATHYFTLNGNDVYYCRVIKMQLHTIDGDTGVWYPLHGSVKVKPL